MRCCKCFLVPSLLTRLVEDHLPGGKLDDTDETLIKQAKSVPKTNTVSERDFAQLDCLLREKTKCIYSVTGSHGSVQQQQNHKVAK